MNPGLVVKLRPAGPWRIGPDSGARNKVDAIYHSDSLYAAVTSAMARLGSLDDWLDATARSATPDGLFQLVLSVSGRDRLRASAADGVAAEFAASMGGRVRWKSARFVPLGIVQAVLAGQRLDDNQWTVDGASECLVPAGRRGPFRTVYVERGGRSDDRRDGAPLDGMRRISGGRGIVDGGVVSR